MECERRKIYIKPILKEMTLKTLRMINIKLDKGLQKAMIKFLELGSKGGKAINSVIFADNNLSD